MTDDRDVIHISPWLVKVLAGSILAGLGSIAVYMVAWAVQDLGFKREVLMRLQVMDKNIDALQSQQNTITTNTQKISDLKDRVTRLENQP